MTLECPPAHLCGCGCGGIPRGSRSLFLVGHYSRVAPRPGKWIGSTRERSLCRCGCGELVSTFGASFRPGHQNRSPEVKARQSESKRIHQPHPCGLPSCSEQIYHGAAVYCSRWCSRMALLDVKPWCSLQRRILRELHSRRVTFSAFFDQAGMKSSTLARWFKIQDSALPRGAAPLLARALGMQEAMVIKEAGGVTAEARMLQVGQSMAKRNFAAKGSELARDRASAAASSRLGHRQAREITAKSVATRRANGSFERWVSAGIKETKSLRGLLRSSLLGRLRVNSAPSVSLIRQWAAQAGKTYGLSGDAVFAEWEPLLLRKSIVKADRGGRPARLERCRLMREALQQWPWTGEGRAPNGFFKDFGARVDLTYDAARQWWTNHQPCADVCPKKGITG